MKEMIKEIIREEMSRAQEKTYYFMAGLPRSGSTMLSAILNQNPRFYSGPSSPVTGLMIMLEQQISQDELFRAFPKNEQAGQIIANVIKHYYSDVEEPVIFDKNRSWVNRIHYIPGYFGREAKIICPVRNTSEILSSFIAMHKRNPYEVNGKINFLDEMLVKSNISLTDENRCQLLMSEMGIVGQSYTGLKQALMKGKQKNLHFVEYEDLVTNTEATMRKLYEFLGEEYYEAHDYENLENVHKENDAEVYGFSDMHDIRKSVGKSGINPEEILPESILKACEGSEFWRSIEEDINTGDTTYQESVTDDVDNNSSTSNEKLIGA
jgi:sulfotransferase